MRMAQTGAAVAPPAGTRPAAWQLGALGAGLAAYNVALNHVPFPAWSYVPANLALALAVTLLARRRWALGARELGLARAGVRPGLVLAAAVVAAAALALVIAPALPWAAPLLADRRASGLAGPGLAYAALVRIPLGTAVPEELLFRGVLLAAYRRRGGALRAALASSVAFGLWHAGPALVAADASGFGLSPAGLALAVAAAVVLTTGAGMLLCLLRRWGRGLLAPVVVHAAVNGLSLLAAVRFQA